MRQDRNHGESPTIKDNRSKSRPSDQAFQTFSLDGRVLRGIRAAEYTEPRPIQAKTIPAVLEGRDVLGLAQTGTGKTAAFALPILSNLLARRGRGGTPRALILAPTRELASQIDRELGLLGGFTPIRSTTVFGGVPISRQIRALRQRPDIVVACPGRLLDLYDRRDIDLRHVEVLVLDEADHMFDMGFLPSIRRILAALPQRRQNLLFSATMPNEIRHLTDDVLNRPHVVELDHSAPAQTIEHALYPVAEVRKQDLLEHLLGGRDFTSAIVFVRTKVRARRLAERLGRRGHAAIALQGNMSQSKRDQAMQGFRDGRYDVLVATDIAARGIDVVGVSHVINYDVPNTPDAYTHRIGRTGRSERQGTACTFVTSDDHAQVRAIEKRLGAKIAQVRLEAFAGAGGRRSSGNASSRANTGAGAQSRGRTGSSSTRNRGGNNWGSAKSSSAKRPSGRRAGGGDARAAGGSADTKSTGPNGRRRRTSRRSSSLARS